MKPNITHEELLSRLSYNKATGIFINKKTGMRTGHYDKWTGQRGIDINGKKYKETRLAVFYVHGQWPEGNVSNKSKNRISVTKYKDLVFSLPDRREHFDASVFEQSITANESLFKKFLRWLNG